MDFLELLSDTIWAWSYIACSIKLINLTVTIVVAAEEQYSIHGATVFEKYWKITKYEVEFHTYAGEQKR